ncbi:ShlB/FhaC/HecB family hemolysin secretion/activation protein [Dolichospermum sp. LEGE 00246]|uniref:ShlB/FhaC/HecB family hemolysin secretion/activation protein n=1 Tax=Dolichospermum sp. LEGE 00246 TaxID=1828605 RepID=UPI00187F3D25|nr:ShlB/FhaC/HecB family hemolysin secretion/activation protein [Dolichospermum sp. LEGE 00246]MBE9257605.1 ShlB/FhaC/HecB family hemolysin secretion/activation protein [Dolichospermum sp. LEGE 00246]
MNWCLKSGSWCLFLVPSVVLTASISPSYAEVSNSSLLPIELPDQRLAQAPNPDGDRYLERFVQPTSIPEQLTPKPEEPLQVTTPENPPPSTPTPTDASSEDKKFEVKTIEVKGSTIFNSEQLSKLTRPVEGKIASLEELRQVADAITQLYWDRGYLTSRAILANSAIIDGVVQIRIIESSVVKIEIEGTKRINPNYVRSRIALGIRKPLNTGDIEEQLRLLQGDPFFSKVEGILRPGTDGQIILVVKVTEAEPFKAALNIDNYSPPSIGSERFGVNAVYRNLTGWGDELAASYYFTARGGSNIYDLSYRLPVNAMNGTLQLRTSINNNKVIQEPFDIFNIQGESQLYEINFRQPLVRSLRQELALSLGFTVQDGQTFTFAGPTGFGFGPDDKGNSRTRVLKFGQEYLARDTQGAWSLRSLFSLGIDVFDATKNADPIPDGQFFSWLGQIQRVQRVSNDYLLIAQTDIQLTPNGLLPSQQFVIGGGQSVRGYRQNARAGDNGVRFVLENQLTIHKDESGNPLIKIAPFVDLGYVWNTNDNPNRLQRQTFLAGTGIGVLWQLIPNLNIRLDYGVPLINLDDRGKNAQDEGFYFSVGYKL